MYCVRNVRDDFYWVGGNDQRIERFENIHPLSHGVSYNSYLVLDEKTVLLDTVDWNVSRDFLRNIKGVLNGRDLDCLIVNHMEPDHCASIELLLDLYPNLQIYSTKVSFNMMDQFGFEVEGHKNIVKEKDTLNTGKYTFEFIEAPMVHWPEVIVTYEQTTKTLFSADAFGTFGTLDGRLFDDEFVNKAQLLVDARRYYANIVGKYGSFVQRLFKKLDSYEIEMIAPLHGPVFRTDLAWILKKYNQWSTNTAEDDHALLIVYGSMYGNTEYAAQVLASKLVQRGVTNIAVYDVSNTHVSDLISESFRTGHIVLMAPSYNGDVYPLMTNYIHDMKLLEVQNKTFALVQNGTWAPVANRALKKQLEELKNINVLEGEVTIRSSMTDENDKQLAEFADAIVSDMNKAE